jgi:DNA-binding MurR/RpiR family transcriptional regulator
MTTSFVTETGLENEGPIPDDPTPLALLGGVLARMQVHEPSFTVVERRIAEALRSNGRELVGLPVEELAARVGVSQASVVRFCRRLGYTGLREFKLALAAEVRGEPVPGEPSIAAGDGFDAIARKVTAAAQRALTDSLEVLDRGALERATEALVRASRVQLFGVGGSAPIAQDAHYRFARLGVPVAVLTDAQLQPVVAARLVPGSVAFVVSHTGRSREPVHVLEEAKDAGATTILLTSFANTPAARWADIVLLTAPVATAPWGGMAPLRVAQLTVIDMLCVAIAARDDDELRDFRARYDALLGRHMLPGGNGMDRIGVAATTETGAGTSPGQPAPLQRPASTTRATNPPVEDAVRSARRVRIDGVPNSRHLGGIPIVGAGETAPVVIRSGVLWQITPGGIRQLQALGVTDIVDLRYDADLLTHPTPNLDSAGIAIVRAPMYEHPETIAPDIDDRAGWVAFYQTWAERSQPAMRTLLETIAHAEGSVLVHCHLGEDRSGIATALLLDLVGVDETEILADYAMSPNGPGFEFLISAVLTHVRERWGATVAFFRDAGVDEEVLARARARLAGHQRGDP